MFVGNLYLSSHPSAPVQFLFASQKSALAVNAVEPEHGTITITDDYGNVGVFQHSAIVGWLVMDIAQFTQGDLVRQLTMQDARNSTLEKLGMMATREATSAGSLNS